MTEAFRDRIDEVVLEFLETALVVDDEAGLWSPGLQTRPSSGADGTTDPGEPGDAGANPGSRPRSRLDLSLEEPSPDALDEAEKDHPLMAKALIDAFADAGIICSVLAVSEEDPIEERVLSAAGRADLLVLDWEMHRDGGAKARRLISAVTQQDDEAIRKRLRVIAIYTGQPKLAGIVEEIRGHLGFPKEALDDGGVTLAQGNTRITAFSKPLHEKTSGEMAERQVAEHDLPKRLVREFAWVTDGLVPAVALASLAAIRIDAHRILQALSGSLDVGYLGHRAALSFPEEAQDHLVDMIVAEIGSVLGENDVGRYANLEVIKEWVALAQSGDDPVRSGSALDLKAQFDSDGMERLLEVGLGRDEQLETHELRGVGVKVLKHVRKRAAHLFTNDGAEADESADLLALRMAVRTAYTRPARRLRLGTIILREDQYLICLQPRCDSVRLRDGIPRGFPFLPLEVVRRDVEARRDFVVESPESGDLVRLRLLGKPFDLIRLDFVGGAPRYVQAVSREEGGWEFADCDGVMYRWVAELKPEFAQRVAANLAAEIARVGLAESELVRRSRD